MKKLQFLFLDILIIITVLLLDVRQLGKTSDVSGAKVLTTCNWGGYIGPSLITKFEKEYGYKVNRGTFDSNEAMFTKTQRGGTNYDVTIPGGYMIQKMIRERLVLPLDHSKTKELDNIDSRLLDLDFNSDSQYLIPYFWGTLRIMYSDKFFDANQVKHWSGLWKPELKDSLMPIDGVQEVMGFPLNSLGYSLNSKNMAQLTEAANKLNHLTPNVKTIVTGETKTYMANEETSVAVTFSGEAANMMWENEYLHYVIPPEGSNLWFDNIIMPETVKNKEGAYDFINFMLEPENATQNAEYIGYSTPNEEAKTLLSKDILSDEQFYPSDDTISHLGVYKDLGSKYLSIYSDLFLEFEMYRG